MENKYYTPEIEDIRVEYECEIKPLNNEYDWLPAKLKYEKGYNGKGLYDLNPFWYSVIDKDGFPVKAIINDLSQVRTPYLTKEQIEGEGWLPVKEGSQIGFAYKKDDWTKCIFYKIKEDTSIKHMVHIYLANKDESIFSTIYLGEMKSINEFRMICKLLNIK